MLPPTANEARLKSQEWTRTDMYNVTLRMEEGGVSSQHEKGEAKQRAPMPKQSSYARGPTAATLSITIGKTASMLDLLGVVPASHAPQIDADNFTIAVPFSSLSVELRCSSVLENRGGRLIPRPYHPACVVPLFPAMRQRAWILTTLASSVMTAFARPGMRDYLTMGGVQGMESRVWAVGVNRFSKCVPDFTLAPFAYLTADMVVGGLCYRSQIGFLTDWVHHVLYILITETAIRNGWAHLSSSPQSWFAFSFLFCSVLHRATARSLPISSSFWCIRAAAAAACSVLRNLMNGRFLRSRLKVSAPPACVESGACHVGRIQTFGLVSSRFSVSFVHISALGRSYNPALPGSHRHLALGCLFRRRRAVHHVCSLGMAFGRFAFATERVESHLDALLVMALHELICLHLLHAPRFSVEHVVRRAASLYTSYNSRLNLGFYLYSHTQIQPVQNKCINQFNMVEFL
ncbi:hypothetical protein K438DRAFT_1765306 [Mycena galopus ATCC 62051]|nr:hypothetical protein K438DRAFT_1765306 [Mycena galopus ATCC 62051]